ncbi:MAG: DUF2207 domain-containing protein [Actinomycetota bacterium]|nr:DUF2207 domain-containing protein [Actinomycetota bacterium]
MDDLYVPDPTLLWFTAAGIGAWFFLLGVMWAMRLPGRVRAGPETTDLGSESPALANLVTHRFNPTRDVVPATLVDLAARGLIEIEDRGLGNYFCRLTGRSADVAPYEQMMVDHLRSVTADGVVPAEALTTGPQDRSKAWWNAFKKKVVVHAQAEGLSKDLWSLAAQIGLLLAATPLALLYWIAIGFRDADELARSALLDGVTIGGGAVLAALLVVGATKRQTSTPEGEHAAARWLGVRRALEESPSFEMLPPSGVAVWERHLAYAAALGVASRSISALPMGAESDTEAWTASSGAWRKVTVRYPRWRPGWGRHPLLAVVVGTFGSYVGYRILRLATDDIGFGGGWTIAPGTVATAIALTFLARSVPQLFWGLADLLVSKEVEGRILRARTRWGPVPYLTQGDDDHNLRCFIAIDDARSESIAAYRVTTKKYGRVAQGATVKLKVTPNLGYVSRIDGRRAIRLSA